MRVAARWSMALLLAAPLGLAPPSAGPAVAQEALSRDAASHADAGRLPPESRTQHTVELPGRTLRFTATAGAIVLTNSQGAGLAEIGYVAYTLDGAEPRSRPVTFAFNGGPGAASTWLHIGAMGPWRLPLTVEMTRAAATPTLLPNAETWLDFTDLVFIDPAGTGYSRVLPTRPVAVRAPDGEAGQRGGRDARRREGRETGGTRWFWSVMGDVDSLAETIHIWLRRNDRLAAPKAIVGESYGGFRAPQIAYVLQRVHGVDVHALVLVSPVLDFDGRRGGYLPAWQVNLLPSIAAARIERTGVEPSRDKLADVEDYARGQLVADLLRGPRDRDAVERISTRVAAISGLTIEAVRNRGGRISGGFWLQEFGAAPGGPGGSRAISSVYDAGLTGFEPVEAPPGARFGDPFTAGLSRPMTRAMLDLYARLGWRPERSYAMLSSETNRGWVWPNSPSPPETLSALGDLLARDHRLKVLVTHGFTDLVTPYMASRLQLDQLAPFPDPGRVSLEVYAGGHMHYSRDASRPRFRVDAERVLRDATEASAHASPPRGTW